MSYLDLIQKIIKENAIDKAVSKGIKAVGPKFRLGGAADDAAKAAELKAASDWLDANTEALKAADIDKLTDYIYNVKKLNRVPDELKKAMAGTKPPAAPAKPAPAEPAQPRRRTAPAPNPALPIPSPGPGRRYRPGRTPGTTPKKPTETPVEPKPETTPAPAKPARVPVEPKKPEVDPWLPAKTPEAPVKVPFKPGVEPVKPAVEPTVKPAPVVRPGTKPAPATSPAPGAKPVSAPRVDVVPQTAIKPEIKPEAKPEVKPKEKVKDKVKTKGTKGGAPFLPFFGAKGQDLRTHVTGTGVREEYISEQEGFKKFKVMYILNGEEKTNVYRYKGKEAVTKARVLRQLRERGAGSIRFMQYESVEEGVSWSPGVGWIGGASDEGVDEREDGYRVNPKTGENERVYGYGYKSSGRRRALPQEKYYHKVSFKDKEHAKAEGMKWDPNVKKWYHTDKYKTMNSRFEKLDEAYMPDATRKPVVYRAPPKRGEVVGKMKVRLIRRHQDVMPGERTATSENTKRLRRLVRKVLKKGKLKRPS